MTSATHSSRRKQSELFAAGEDLPLFTGLNPAKPPAEPVRSPCADNLGGPSLPLFRTTRVVEFYPHMDAHEGLYGEPVSLCVGTLIERVRVGRHDPDKWLVKAGDRFAWIWSDFVTA